MTGSTRRATRPALTPRRLPRPGGPLAPSVATVPPDSVLATSSGGPALSLTKRVGLAHTDNPNTDIEPPDPWIGVGPDNVVQMTNIRVKRTDREGGHSSTVSLADFFGLPTDPVTYDADGRIVFDAVHGRWVASELSYDCAIDTFPGDPATMGHGYVDIGVSRTADPNGAWDFTFVFASDFFLDYPSLGSSTDKIGTGVNLYGMTPESSPGAGDCYAGSFAGADVVVWDWSALLKLASAQPDLDVVPVPNGFAPRVALQTPATSSTMFVVAIGAPSDVRVLTITGLVGTTSSTITTALDVDLTATGVVPGFAVPPPPHQSGSPATIADAGDGRPTDAVWRENRLVFASTNTCTPTDDSTARSCARFTELATSTNPATAPTRRQDVVIGQNGYDTFMPGVGYAGDGTIHLAWARSSASTFVDSMASYQRTSDAVTTIADAAVVTAGVATYDGTRWGDYVGVAQDPQVPDAAWTANEYAAADGLWATTVARLQTRGLRYVPIAPVRVLDSRPGGTGLSGKFVHATPRSFAVAGVAGVPANARAITGNVTVVNQQAGGFVSVTPRSITAPSTSTINFPLGDVRANNLTATLGAGGKLWAVYRASTSKTTDLILDVTGYYVDDPNQAGYSPIAPVRMLDSRSGVAIGVSGKFHGNTPRRLALGDVSVGGSIRVPNTAIAITGNLTIVNQTKSGFVAITTTSQPTPSTSTLNFPVKDIRANGVTVPLDDDPIHRGVWIVYRPSGSLASDTADLILDVTGYFTPSGGGVAFHPLNPGRTMDSRPGSVLSGLGGKFHALVSRTLDVDGRWGVPNGAVAITGNVTVVGQTHSGYVAVVKDPPASVPATSTINFPAGDVRANGITVPLSTSPAGNVSIEYAGAPSTSTTDLIVDLSGYFQ